MFTIIVYFTILTAVYMFKDGLLKFFKYLKFQYKFWIFYVWLLFACTILIPIFAFRPQNVKNTLILAKLTKLFNYVAGIRWQLRNSKVLSEDRGAVIVANHQYALDMLGFGNIWHAIHKCAVVSKKELSYLGPVALCLYLIGTIFIDRKRPKDAYKELQIQADKYFHKKIKIWIFPEGTRSNNLTRILPFKKGAFMMAVASQVPIIPVVYSPYYFINNKRNIFNRGHIIVQCLEPVSTVGLTMEDVPELTERVQNIIYCAYKELLREVRSELPPNYPLEIEDSEN